MSLFSPVKIGPMTIKNRFMCSSVSDYMVQEDGTPNDNLLNVLEGYSKWKSGLIVPGFTQTLDTWKAIQNQSTTNRQKHTDIWKKTIQKVHKNGSKIALQITHAGIDALSNIENMPPSGYPSIINKLSTSEIEDVIDSFIKTSLLAKKIGADGVELYGAYGLLHSSFLSPLFNHRYDKYGGSLEKRSRIVSETAKYIKKEAGRDFAILLKLNETDFHSYTALPDLVSKYVNHLKKNIDMFEISCGNYYSNATLHDNKEGKRAKDAYFKKFFDSFNISYAEFIKSENPDTTIATIGTLRSRKLLEEAINDQKFDVISISEPYLNEPYFFKDFH